MIEELAIETREFPSREFQTLRLTIMRRSRNSTKRARKSRLGANCGIEPRLFAIVWKDYANL